MLKTRHLSLFLILLYISISETGQLQRNVRQAHFYRCRRTSIIFTPETVLPKAANESLHANNKTAYFDFNYKNYYSPANPFKYIGDIPTAVALSLALTLRREEAVNATVCSIESKEFDCIAAIKATVPIACVRHNPGAWPKSYLYSNRPVVDRPLIHHPESCMAFRSNICLVAANWNVTTVTKNTGLLFSFRDEEKYVESACILKTEESEVVNNGILSFKCSIKEGSVNVNINDTKKQKSVNKTCFFISNQGINIFGAADAIVNANNVSLIHDALFVNNCS